MFLCQCFPDFPIVLSAALPVKKNLLCCVPVPANLFQALRSFLNHRLFLFIEVHQQIAIEVEKFFNSAILTVRKQLIL